MNHKGTQVLNTDRLILRPIRLKDAQAMIKNWVSDKEVTRYLTWNAYSDLEKAKEFIRFSIERNKELNSYRWCLQHKEADEAIGTIDVLFFSEKHEAAEVGYCMSRRYWNKGIMTEALSAVINFLINEVGFNRIQATHFVENIGSGRVMQKCGMKFEGIKRQGSKNNQGQFCDSATYAILKSDLNSLQ